MKHLFILAAMTLMTIGARAQSGPNPSDAPVSAPVATTIYTLQELEIGHQPAAWWTDLRNDHLEILRDGSDAERRQVLLNVIYLANYHRDAIDFGRQMMPLIYTYRFNTDESMRILALAAMLAVGDDAVMRNLAHYVQHESSPRVRKLTNAALADYFGITHLK